PEPGSNSSLYNFLYNSSQTLQLSLIPYQKNQRFALSDFNQVKIGTCLYLFSYSFNELPFFPKRAANVRRFF
ncbi:MAG: hypothetical protein IJU08_03920, partial [Bacteroidales bacterium]|nr:hypothetical protein [Bacteroidales bacterium]